MKAFTAFEYLLIDVANHWGLDKLTFEERIQWSAENLHQLEDLDTERTIKEHEAGTIWKERPLFVKAYLALRRVQRGEATGHLVGLDAVCSGAQIMSATTGCHAGAEVTGLVNPHVRADAYTSCTDVMREKIPTLPENSRKSIKDAMMTTLYGSEAEPKKLFGDGSKELAAFYEAMLHIVPGACELLNDLLQSWQPYSVMHSWVMPDNHHVHVRPSDKKDARIRIDELSGASFTYRYEDTAPTPVGKSNVANVVHSIDAWVLRTLIRRCSYEQNQVFSLSGVIQLHLLERNLYAEQDSPLPNSDRTGSPDWAEIALERFMATSIVDLSVINHLNEATLSLFPTAYLQRLCDVLNQMLTHPSFDVVCVHDEFKCHPLHMNQLRYHYKEILAELADSTILSDILSHILGQEVTYQKLSDDLAPKIRQSNYALC